MANGNGKPIWWVAMIVSVVLVVCGGTVKVASDIAAKNTPLISKQESRLDCLEQSHARLDERLKSMHETLREIRDAIKKD